MARQIENQTARTNYPIHPFGPHAGTREIVMTYGGPTVDTDDIPPVRGCSFDDPLSNDDKDLLCALSLARIDAGGQFAVDYEALRAHLRAVCGVRDTDLHGLTWVATMQILRPIAQKPGDRPALTELEQELLFVFDEREILTTTPQAARVLRERGTGRDEATVKRAVRHLLALGLIERPQTPDGRPTRKGSRVSEQGKRYLATS